MKFGIEFTQTAASHIRAFRKSKQNIVLDAIEKQLAYEPTYKTRNRKHLGGNELADWELRVRKYRIFYDVICEENIKMVKVKAVGLKEHNILYIGGKEIKL